MTTLASPRRRQLALALGDALLLIVFAAAGRADHGLPFGDNPVLTVLLVAAPFALAWYALAWLAGVYRADGLDRPLEQARRTALAWLAAGGVGLVLRAMLNGQATIIVSFAQVALSLNLALFLAWHLAFSMLAARGRW
jgi:hypothetical protein